MIYNARDLAAMDPDTLWGLPEGPMKVQFDDGVLETSLRPTVFSAYMWRLYVLYPKTPARMDHHLRSERIGSDTHRNMLNKVMWDCYDAYGGEVSLEVLTDLIYEETNRIYNDFIERCDEYVETLIIDDFLDVLYHPKVAAANANVRPTQLSIDHCYKQIRSVLMDPRELIGNPIATAAKNKLVSMGQIQQCVGPRGFVTDVDSHIFRFPILTGFVQGINTLYGSMAESRSASKALSFTEKPLQDTEYFNREMQLMAQTFQRIHPGDCKASQTLPWRIEGNDLETLWGKYYVKPDGSYGIVTPNDVHLKGETLQLRSVFHCEHPDSNGVCSVCYGQLSLSIPVGTNVGHVAATALCEKVSQRVLSVKHEDGSSTVSSIELSAYDQKYLRLGTDPNSIKLAERLEGTRVILTVMASEAKRLPDLAYVDTAYDLPIANVSELTEVRLKVVGRDNEEELAIVPVSTGARKSSLSHELLQYAKEHGWSMTPNGDFCFDLSEWDMEQPAFVLPLKHANMLDYMKTIERFIKASATQKRKAAPRKGAAVVEVKEEDKQQTIADKSSRTLRDCATLSEALREFNMLVSSELYVNIVHLEVLIHVMRIRSWEMRDHRLPLAGNDVVYGSFTMNMAMRSMSAQMAHEKQKAAINNPATYLTTVRPDHPMDPLLMPRIELPTPAMLTPQTGSKNPGF